MKIKKQKIKKLFGNIFNILNSHENTLSVSLVGSFSNHFDFNKSGDIDIVVICNELKKNYFDHIKSEIRKFKSQLLFFSNKNHLKFNTTFGPIKFDNTKTLIIHLMVYDYIGHKKHVIESPFTCFDWEKSKFYKGKRLSNIYPVLKLQMSDFLNSRRGTNNILNDLKNKRISYGIYLFRRKKIILRKDYFSLDDYNINIFIYNIYKNMINNLIKFQIDSNSNFSALKLKKKLIEITDEKNEFKELDLSSKKRFTESLKKIAIDKIVLTSIFLKYYKKYVKKYSSLKKIHFIRHKKTEYSSGIFLGTKLNPSIIKIKKPNNTNKVKYDICYSSPMIRTIETASLLVKKNIIKIDKNLNEIDYGKYEGLNFNEVKLIDKKFSINLTKNKDPKFPNGENTRDVLKRIKNFFNFLTTPRNKYKLILVVTHNVVMRCILGVNLGIKMKDWYKLKIPYYTKFEIIVYEQKILLNISRTKLNNIIKNIYG